MGDPALSFWLDWAEHEGAACERGIDSNLVLLPGAVAHPLGLSEELAVTADPEVAREDGALLLTAGHPAVDAAADTVLRAGDVGQVVLTRPAAVPRPEDLLAKAREQFPVDHGRLDLAGVVQSELLPVLRIGALLSHQVSLHDRFQERAELWVDVVTGTPMPGRLIDR